MAEHSQEVKIYKNGELVATARNFQKVEVPLPPKPAPGNGETDAEKTTTWTCFHFPSVRLGRIQVFQVLNRKPLGELFNNAGIETEQERVEPVFYIHGRVEAFHGNPHISSVVLGFPNQEVDVRKLVPQLPEIYKRVSLLI